MSLLTKAEVNKFFEDVYLFLSIAWLYVGSMILFALYEDDILQAPNSSSSSAHDANWTTAATTVATTAGPNATNSTSYVGGVYNPFPYIPVLVLTIVFPFIVTHVLMKRANRNLFLVYPCSGINILFGCFYLAIALIETTLFLLALMPQVPFLLKSIPLIIIFGGTFLAVVVLGAIFCRNLEVGRGAAFFCCAAILGGLCLPEIVFVSMKLDGWLDWRWNITFIPFWILDIILIFFGITMAQFHGRKLASDNVSHGDGDLVALQFLGWVTIVPLIIFQVLICVREDQIDPVIPLPENVSNVSLTTLAPQIHTTLAPPFPLPNATIVPLTGLELISPILAGWACTLLVPVVHAGMAIAAATQRLCARLRDYEKRFRAFAREQAQRTITQNPVTSSGDSGDIESNSSQSTTAEVESAPTPPQSLQEEWFMSVARLRYAESERQALQALEELQALTSRDNGVLCTNDNRDVVTAVARDLRSEAKAKIISAPSAADIDRRQQNEATRMFLFKPEQYFQLFNGRNAVASSNDGGEPDGPIWTAATSKSLQVLLMLMLKLSQNIRVLATETTDADCFSYLGIDVSSVDARAAENQ